MNWLDNFERSVEQHTDVKVKKKVLEGIQEVPKGSTKRIRKTQAQWIKNAIDKLHSLVDDEKATRILVDTCPHKYPEARIKKMKELYQELGNLDQLLEVMRNDTSWRGYSFYDYPTREGNIIHVTKGPYKPKAYEEATTREERIHNYCHCPIARSLMDEMPSTFCCCSGGWVKQLWEGVLERPLEVRLTESILKGDERCTHSFEIPSV